jgi:hypothetical protein
MGIIPLAPWPFLRCNKYLQTPPKLGISKTGLNKASSAEEAHRTLCQKNCHLTSALFPHKTGSITRLLYL